MSNGDAFDPYVLLEALERNRVSYVVVGAFARIVHGSAEVTRGIDIAPSLRDDNIRRLGQALDELGAPQSDLASDPPVAATTPAGTITIIPNPWGTRGYDELRIRASRENLGRGLRPRIASTVDLVRMLETSDRPDDTERLHRLRRMMELERRLTRDRGRSLER